MVDDKDVLQGEKGVIRAEAGAMATHLKQKHRANKVS